MDGARSLLRGRWALLILALALVLRVAQIAATPHWQPVSDPADYVRHAVSISHGHGMADSFLPGRGPSALRPPAYPYFLGGVFAVSGDSFTAGRLAAALLGVISVALIGAIALLLCSRAAALAAMAIAAVYPPLVLVSGTLLSESLGLPLVLALLVLVLAYREEPRPAWVAPVAGLVFALALLDRPALVPFGIPLVAGLWGRPWRSRAALRTPAIAVAVAVLAVLPWTIRNAIDFNAFVPVSTQSGFLVGGTYNATSDHDPVNPGAYRPASFDPALRPILADPSLDENEVSKKLSRAGRTYAKDHPGYVPRVFWWNGLRLIGAERPWPTAEATYQFQGIGSGYAKLALVAWYLLALGAIAGLARGAARGVPWWLWIVPLLLFVSVIAISSDLRYRVPIEPFLIWVAAAGLTGRRPAQPPAPTQSPPR
jgi:4-amino-4-deoxy-L-arabinose transferase-like glycosyltransferase